MNQKALSIQIEDHELLEAMRTICFDVRKHGGKALLVGGSVRDAFFQIPTKDLDLEVYGIQPEKLKQILAQKFSIDLVGQAFGVLKIRGKEIDISIPRRESKIGQGHKGFETASDPNMSIKEAASRRDFTLNSIFYDPLEEKLIDPYNGLADLEKNILRHTSDKFSEDPLRVLRGMQFAARFDLQVASETTQLSQTIALEGLAKERIFEEWKKLILHGKKPSAGLRFLRDSKWIRFFPELENLIDCPQSPHWHPEGDVWIHTLHCMDAYSLERIGDDWEDLVVGMTVLCHDFGKPTTTIINDAGKISSKKHEMVGKKIAQQFLDRMTNQQGLFDQVAPLIFDHLSPSQFYRNNARDNAVRRLATRVGRIDRLVRVARADQRGRPPIPWDDFPAGAWLLEKAKNLKVEKSGPDAIVLGRHLIQLGVTPSPQFKVFLDQCYEAQLDGEITTIEEGIEFVKKVLHD
ncbi:MAG: tRNA nucleotidyltransferase (CCA-adding enzyme) [bacterium]|jgi:tRNA nucleotidyltransferase (CCA-adding enzyme)